MPSQRYRRRPVNPQHVKAEATLLKRQRKYNAMTQKEAAMAFCLSYNRYNEIERGFKPVPFHMVADIQKLYGVDPVNFSVWRYHLRQEYVKAQLHPLVKASFYTIEQLEKRSGQAVRKWLYGHRDEIPLDKLEDNVLPCLGINPIDFWRNFRC